MNRERGFGKRLIEDQLPLDIDAAGRIDFTPEGVRATVKVPVSAGLVTMPQAPPGGTA